MTASPTNTVTGVPVSVSFAVAAMATRLALLVAPVVDTVTVSPTAAPAQVLRTVSWADLRALVTVQVIASSPTATVNRLLAVSNGTELPVQARVVL